VDVFFLKHGVVMQQHSSNIWNSLPDDVISAESLPTFERKLKRHLFCQSFHGFCCWHSHLQWTLQWQCHL